MSFQATSQPASPAPQRIAVFEYGFRPFFLCVGLYAVIAALAWLAILTGRLGLPSAWPPSLWHGHEMVFGVAGAGVAGFMLTAVPNWTGAAPLRRAPLALLVALWAAGRAALWGSGTLSAPVVAVVDLSFLPLLGMLLAPALLAAGKGRNLVFVALLVVLETANLLTHLEALDLTIATARPGLRLGIGTVMIMIALVGGRIVPTFTTNALRQAAAEQLPHSHAPVDALAIVLLLATVSAMVFRLDGVVLGGFALAAGAAHAVRLSLWQPLATLRMPILWVLHLGYAWLVAGLALLGLSGFGLVPESAALHAVTVGAIGTMLLGVMSRAALGHTGRPLVAARLTVAAYAMVSAAAMLRMAGAVEAAGIAWVAAFVAFLWVYVPVLTLPRIDGRPG